MLLCALRSPYAEHKKGLYNQDFISDDYYSIGLIEELDEGLVKNEGKGVILTG